MDLCLDAIEWCMLNGAAPSHGRMGARPSAHTLDPRLLTLTTYCHQLVIFAENNDSVR